MKNYIRFTAYIKKAEIKILINIEAQKSSDHSKLGYHLENRIVFYLARMISAQKQTEFFHSDFDNLKKVRSIWICMDNDETEDSAELEGRIQIMCNLSENIIERERIDAIKRMIKANASKERIIFLDIRKLNIKKQNVHYTHMLRCE